MFTEQKPIPNTCLNACVVLKPFVVALVVLAIAVIGLRSKFIISLNKAMGTDFVWNEKMVKTSTIYRLVAISKYSIQINKTEMLT